VRLAREELPDRDYREQGPLSGGGAARGLGKDRLDLSVRLGRPLRRQVAGTEVGATKLVDQRGVVVRSQLPEPAVECVGRLGEQSALLKRPAQLAQDPCTTVRIVYRLERLVEPLDRVGATGKRLSLAELEQDLRPDRGGGWLLEGTGEVARCRLHGTPCQGPRGGGA
jgi:hypothetical protein